MSASCLARAPRQVAVLATIVGLHAGAAMLVIAGFHSRVSWLAAFPPPLIYQLPTPPKPPPEAPRTPGPLDYGLPLVPEPQVPIPKFDDPTIPQADVRADGEPQVGSGPGVPAPELRAPMLRTGDKRLAALINACFPSASRRLAEEGRAVVRIDLDATGRISAWNIVEGSGYARLDAAVECVVRRLEFIPARRDGEAVAANALLPVVFRLD